MLEKEVLFNLLRFLQKGMSLNCIRKLLRMRKDTFSIFLKQTTQFGFLIKKDNYYILSEKGKKLIKEKKISFFRCSCHTGFKIPRKLLLKAKVAVSPGIGFGSYGDDSVRIALIENEKRIRQAARNIKKFLK